MKRFRCSPEQLELIASPAAYLQTLQALTAGARRRVFLSALYLGTDAQSRSLVGSCGEALRAGAEVRLLLDRGRATRPGASSLEALAPLLAGEQRGKAARVHLWESPAAAGSPLRGLPRWGELAGVFHGKAQVADGAVLLSGANLSQSYFTDRRDRYLLLHSPEVADFFFGLLETLAAFAGEAGSGERPRRGTAEMRAAVERLFAAEEGEEEEKEGSDSQHVTVRPTCQLGCAGISIDERIVGGFLEGLPEGGELWLASGYFNLTSAHEALLFRLADRLQVNVLVSAPGANAWHGSRGLSRHVPNAYSELEARFLRRAPPGIRLYEWSNADGWSFHCKGLWHFGRDGSAATVVGSGNFGARSHWRDLEIQALLTSRNGRFGEMLREELEQLRRDCRPVGLAEVAAPARRLPPPLRALLPLVKRYM